MQLHTFFNSSTSYRVRIALALKDVPYQALPVNIRTGEQKVASYIHDVNPIGAVPVLTDGDFRLGQSLAIIDYLDRAYPEPRLIPDTPVERARVLEFALLIACDVHPVNNLRILGYLQDELALTPEQKSTWYGHWIAEGMGASESLLSRHDARGPWCFGEAPSLADVCLVPQMANASRMGCDLSSFPRCQAVFEHASRHPAFVAAQPSSQPDYVA